MAKLLGHWNYADNKSIITPSVPFYSLLRATLLFHFPPNTYNFPNYITLQSTTVSLNIT